MPVEVAIIDPVDCPEIMDPDDCPSLGSQEGEPFVDAVALELEGGQPTSPPDHTFSGIVDPSDCPTVVDPDDCPSLDGQEGEPISAPASDIAIANLGGQEGEDIADRVTENSRSIIPAGGVDYFRFQLAFGDNPTACSKG